MTSSPAGALSIDAATDDRPRRIAVAGNPNTGKTTLFNRLCGEKHKVSNFPGTTQDVRVGRVQIAGELAGGELADLPGAYGLDLEQPESRGCRAVLRGAGAGDAARRPDAVLIVLDATNLERSLAFAAEILAEGIPTAAALTMTADAARDGITIDIPRLAEHLACPVVAVDVRRGTGLDELAAALVAPPPAQAPSEDRRAWASHLATTATARSGRLASAALTERLDDLLTSPVLGLGVFALVMGAMFYVVFKLAQYPMAWIEWIFGAASGAASAVLPEGLLQAMLVDGVLAGVAATVVFLPQICLLFLLIALLEESGYLARAAVMTDRWLRPFGLSGHSFVPLLSAHACALPAIAACRGIPDRRERLATILVAPFMSCTARIPVYVLLTVLLFPGRPLAQTIAFAGCYLLGIAAALVSSILARRALLPGRSRGMAMELPRYRAPSVVGALRVSAERGLAFLRKAGTLILAVSIVLWWLGTFPTSGPSPEGEALRAEAAAVALADERVELEDRAERADARHAAQRTVLGRVGGFVQPVFEPLGLDRQLTIGVLASFAAREVFNTTMAVQVVGTDGFEDEGLIEAMRGAERLDGAGPIFTPAVSWALLVYFVLSMQCLPTVALAAKESGAWKWALLQLGWMLGLAWVAAALTYQLASRFGL